MKKYKWGIIGPGIIADRFVGSLKVCENADIYAVSSRKIDRAQAFAKTHNIPNAYEGADALCADDEIDIVYIANITSAHKDSVLTCLNAGKNVLCEKPIAVNSTEMIEMIECARKNDLFLMEATWTNFHPVILKAREWITQGKIGEIRNISTDFCFNNRSTTKRLFDKSMGGGALLDLGPYTIGVPMVIIDKKPLSTVSSMFIGKEGADETCNALINYENDLCIRSYCSITTESPDEMLITGTQGRIYINQFWYANKADLFIENNLAESYTMEYSDPGFSYEINEVMDCIAAGKKESDIISLSKSLQIVEVFDEIRRQGGLKYDFE